MNINNIREQFPYLKNNTIYFNHASTGPIPKITVEAVKKYLYEKSDGSIDFYQETLNKVKETRYLLAELLNTAPDRIAFIDNVSNAMNLLAQGLQWKTDDEVILFDIEFPANVYPFLNLKQYGVNVKILKTNNWKIFVEDLFNAVTNKTKLISLSHVQFLTGQKLDLKLIGEFCRNKGIIFSVDAIQSLGVSKIDVEDMKIDFLASGIQKWLLGLEGTTIIYVSEDLQNKLNPKYIGWLSVKNAWNLLDYKLILDDTARRFENGTLNYAGIISLNSNLNFFKSIGFDSIQDKIAENSNYLIERLLELGYELLFTPNDTSELAGIITIKSENSTKLFEHLKQQNIICSLREGFIRFSPHFYNTHGEIDKLIDVLES